MQVSRDVSRFRTAVDIIASVNALFVPLAFLLNDPSRFYFVLDSRTQGRHVSAVVVEMCLLCIILYASGRSSLWGRWKQLDVPMFLAASIAGWTVLGVLFPVSMNRLHLHIVLLWLLGWVCFGLGWVVFPELKSIVRTSMYMFLVSTCVVGIRGMVRLATANSQPRNIALAGGLFSEARLGNMVPKGNRLAGKSAARSKIIWIIFDELDQNLTFEALPSSIQLPAFQQVANESLMCESAVPSSYRTLSAIPSMLTGRLLSTGEAIQSRGQTPHSTMFWGTFPNLFSEFHLLGRETAVLGWYHPYCSVLGDSVDHCYSVLDRIDPYAVAAPVLELGKFDFTQIVRQLPALRALRRLWKIEMGEDVSQRELHRERIDLINAQLEKFLNFQSDLLVLHLPLPHLPGIGPAGSGDYFDNLVLTDRILANIRATLEKSNSWESVMVLVTGDHHFRLQYWTDTLEAGKLSERVLTASRSEDSFRVACLLKFPGQKRPERLSAPFNMVLLHDMVRGVAAGSIQTAADGRLWLERNRSRYPIIHPLVE